MLEEINQKQSESRNSAVPSESWWCGRRGHDDVTKSYSTCVSLEDRIACIALPVPPPDLKARVPPPASARCGPIGFFDSEEGPFI